MKCSDLLYVQNLQNPTTCVRSIDPMHECSTSNKRTTVRRWRSTSYQVSNAVSLSSLLSHGGRSHPRNGGDDQEPLRDLNGSGQDKPWTSLPEFYTPQPERHELLISPSNSPSQRSTTSNLLMIQRARSSGPSCSRRSVLCRLDHGGGLPDHFCLLSLEIEAQEANRHGQPEPKKQIEGVDLDMRNAEIARVSCGSASTWLALEDDAPAKKIPEGR